MGADTEKAADTESMENGRACLKLIGIIFFGCVTMVLIWMACAIIFGTTKPPEVEVTSVSVSPFNVSTSASHSEITAKWKIILSVRNRGKNKIINYEQFDIDVLYEKEYLAGAAIEPFRQNEQQRNLVYANISASSAHVSNQIARAIEYELSASGALIFDVAIRITAYLCEEVAQPDIFRPSSRIDNQIWASCDNLQVRFLSNNNTVGAMLKNPPPIPCKITKGHRLW